MSWLWKHRSEQPTGRPEPRPAVRVLHGADELAAATERAAEAQRRLEARLEARARREAERTEPAVHREVIRWADAVRRQRGMPPPRTPAA